MARYWFRPRKYGYGATPTTWQGFALLAGYVVALGLLSWWTQQDATRARLPFFFAAVAAFTIALVWIARRKTDGQWRWRWGGKN